MKRLLGLTILFAASRADAMGVYTNLDIVAWSTDGASALVARDTTSSGTAGSTHDYVLVSAGDKPVAFTFDDTSDPDKATQHVDAATCTKTAAALAKALAAKHFKGVDVKADLCKSTRGVVAISADARRDAELSWVASTANRARSGRETAAWAAAKFVHADAGADVASTTGKLILVFTGTNGDSSGPAHVAAVVPTKDSFTVLVDDLRSVH